MKYFWLIVCLVLFIGCGEEGRNGKTETDTGLTVEEKIPVPEIVDRPSFTVVGIKYRGSNLEGEIGGLWDQFMPRMGEIKNAVLDGVAYGIMDNYTPPDSTDSTKIIGEFDYLACIEVTSTDDIPKGMIYWKIPAQTYAVFTFPFSKLIETYNYALKVWLPKSGYVYAGGPEFEYYPPNFGSVEDSEMKYYIPVEKK